jgi:hypothetical protein
MTCNTGRRKDVKMCQLLGQQTFIFFNKKGVVPVTDLKNRDIQCDSKGLC